MLGPLLLSKALLEYDRLPYELLPENCDVEGLAPTLADGREPVEGRVPILPPEGRAPGFPVEGRAPKFPDENPDMLPAQARFAEPHPRASRVRALAPLWRRRF